MNQITTSMGRYGRRRLRDLHIWIQYFPAQGSGRVEYILGQFPKARKFFAKMQPRVKVNGMDALSAQPTILDPATHPWMQIAAGSSAFGTPADLQMIACGQFFSVG